MLQNLFMEMKIVWTDTALKSYEEIVDYIVFKFTTREAIVFIDKTATATDTILNNKKIGVPHEKTIYRKFLIAKQTYLFYRVENKTIYLTVFWNNIKDPIGLETILRS